VYLVDGKCSVYEHRPRTCRTYDCRLLALAGLRARGNAPINEGLERWEFPEKTAEDAYCLIALRTFAYELIQAGCTIEAAAMLALVRYFKGKAFYDKDIRRFMVTMEDPSVREAYIKKIEHLLEGRGSQGMQGESAVGADTRK
jgi:hypothetical protein